MILFKSSKNYNKNKMDSDEQYLDEDYQFIESIKNKQKYDKKDDLEILELAVQIQNFHMPN